MSKLPSLLCSFLLLHCASKPNRLQYQTFFSPAMKREMDYGIYYPPNWNGKDSLPLVIFLHGGGDNERCFDKHQSFAPIDSAIRNGRVPPFIMAVPNGHLGFWVNWYDSSHHYENYVLDDLLIQIRNDQPVLSDQANTHLLGISMGGTGALYMPIHHPETFASSAVISAPIFDVDAVLEFLDNFWWKHGAKVQRVFGPPDREHVEARNIFHKINNSNDLHGLKLLLAAGTSDRPGIRKSTAKFQRHLKENKIPHSYLTFKGWHKWKDWKQVLPNVLCRQLGTTSGCKKLSEETISNITIVE